MRFAHYALAASVMAGHAAFADTILTYQGAKYTQVSGSFNTSEAVSGTLTVAGSFAPNLNGTVQIFPTSYSFTDGVHQYVLGQPLNQGYIFPYTNANGDLVSLYLQLTLFIPTGTPGEYYGDYLNLQYGPTIPAQDGTFVYTTTGQATNSSNGVLTVTQTSSAITPEPASLALLGTGLVSVLVMTRKRFVPSETYVEPGEGL